MNAPDARISRRSSLDADLLGRTAPLPISWYFDPGWFEREMLLLFEKGPGYVGHELMVPDVGDYHVLPWTEDGKLLVRSADGVGLLSNVCRHRQGLLLEGRGNAQNIVCPLHRWTYDLGGRLLGAPDFDHSPDCSLPKTPLRNWRGLLFAGPRDPAADPDALRAELERVVVHGLGVPFRPARVLLVPDLPRTRNLKIMRRVIRAVCAGDDPGDLTALVNPEAVAELRRLVAGPMGRRG
jgi:nitrite reductase/ring-hydroxylating ferredoxin subunit